MLARAYGIAFPAAVAGIVVGSLVAAPLVAVVGVSGALVVIGLAMAGYTVLVSAGVPARLWEVASVIGSLVSPHFVGRGAELDHLMELAEQVGSGEVSAVLLGGEAGVGKSRLVAELSRRLADDGWRVLTGECVELGGDGLPLAPLADVLRTLARTSRPSELDAYLGAARAELAWLLPGAGGRAPGRPAAASQRPAAGAGPGHGHPDRVGRRRSCSSSRTCTGPTGRRWS